MLCFSSGVNSPADKPALIVFEDVHWLDPTSLELLSRAIDPAFRQRLLLLATARPEFSPPWPNHRTRLQHFA